MVFVICIFISACSFEESNASDELVSTLVEESYYSKNDDEVENKKEQEERVELLEEEGFPIITIRLLLASYMEPQMGRLLQKDADITESANQYLREHEKEYRVLYQTVQMEGEKPTEEELAGADIICTNMSPEESKLYYMDIESELKKGALISVYESVPELYWERVNVNGSIYSLLATPPMSQMMYITNIEELAEEGVNIPEDVIGQDIQVWEEYVSEVYTVLGESGYIMPVGYSDMENPVLAGNAWNTKFQLVLPFLGIEYDNPELGVQSIYESQYAKEMEEFWINWYEKGYFATGGQEVKWRIGLGYDVNIQKTADGDYVYPMQSGTYAVPQVAGVRYYASGVSKTCEKKELVYQFLTEMVVDDELHEAMTMVRGEEEILWFHLVPKTLLVEKNGQAIYTESLEKNIELQVERFTAAEVAPVPGFVFNTEPVQEEVDAILETLSPQIVYMLLSSMQSSGKIPAYAVEIHYIPQELIDVLYEQGLQTVLDEANRQLEAYMSELKI